MKAPTCNDGFWVKIENKEITMNKRAIIIGGGTFNHVRPHLSLAAPAFGGTAKYLCDISIDLLDTLDVEMYTTKMAGNNAIAYYRGNAGHKFVCNTPANMITNEDVANFVSTKVQDPTTKIIFFNTAMCDWDGTVGNIVFDKEASRLSTSQDQPQIDLKPSDKVINSIRRDRKDIFLVAFKHTYGASLDEQYIAGLNLCKSASANLVLANDTKTMYNMIVTPEEARYCVTDNRLEALTKLVEMAKTRSHLTFTRSTVVDGTPVPWDDDRVPQSLRTIVNFCIDQAAYKPFRGVTAGHFAVKLNDQTFLTSIRKTDFNDLKNTGLVLVKTDGPDTVLAYGAKPSVGGQSQRIVFNDHEGMDCIVHFHCPLKENPRDRIPVASQAEYECGSHECGKNTSDNLAKIGNLKVVFLDHHGPNIVFNRNIDPSEVIDFIKANFDLDRKTGGYVTVSG